MFESGFTSSGSNSFQTGTAHTLGVSLAVTGSLKVQSLATDPVIELRVTGSQNQSIDCDPAISNLRDEINEGCGPAYKINKTLACPAYNALWSLPEPWECVKTQTGGAVGQVEHGMKDRILGGSNSCTAPINWPNYSSGDPRIVPLIITPFGTFSGSGNDIVPVIDFAAFYVVGWNGDPCPGAHVVPKGYIAGHFIKYAEPNPNGGRQERLRPRSDHPLRPCDDALGNRRRKTHATRNQARVDAEGTLIAALLIALLAGASILLYLNSYRDSLKAQGALVTVLVAKQTIPKGTSGSVVASKDLYTVTTIRESQLLEGAMSDPATLRDKVATREIFEGAQLTATDFVAGGDSLAAQLTDRERIVSVPLDAAHGLIGGIEPGNRVDVYAGSTSIPLGADGTADQRRPGAADAAADPVRRPRGRRRRARRRDPARRTSACAVDDVKAAKLAFASDNGKVWLALRPSAGAKAVKPGIVTIETMLLGVPPVQVLKSVGGRP